ncbi:MAG: hypothetical protein ACYCX2_01680 [Christensenellales bacterium]
MKKLLRLLFVSGMAIGFLAGYIVFMLACKTSPAYEMHGGQAAAPMLLDIEVVLPSASLPQTPGKTPMPSRLFSPSPALSPSRPASPSPSRMPPSATTQSPAKTPAPSFAAIPAPNMAGPGAFLQLETLGIQNMGSYFSIACRITNTGGCSFRFIKVKATLLDNSMAALCAGWTFAAGNSALAPGENQEFSLLVSSPKGSVSYIRYEILEAQQE